ncbi:MAG: alpha/beta fold hydrolase [Moraxellaceae bacterium]|nr:alpha/beta fold hydrolase [Moraxellaceae bacterium]
MSARQQPSPASTVTRHTIHSGRVKLAAYTRGNPDHPAVVLVHGYPDDSTTWDAVAERLAPHHFVVTYDVRGAGHSDRPKRVRDYTLETLSDDLVAVLDHVVPGRAVHLVGHDWGSIQTWESVTASHLQYRILSFTTISGPCLDHAGHWMQSRLINTNPAYVKKALKQLASSWYIVMFQLPLLAPTTWRLAGQRLHKLIATAENVPFEPRAGGVKDGIFGVNLYRANFLKSLFQPRERYTGKPVQLIVAKQDNYVGAQLFEDISMWARNTWRRDVDAGHWTLLAEGERLAGWIADFVTQVETGKEAAGLTRVP